MFFPLLFVLFAVSAYANHAHTRRSLAIIRRQGVLGNLGDHSGARPSLLFQIIISAQFHDRPDCP